MAERNTIFNSRPLFFIASLPCFAIGIAVEDAVRLNTPFIFVILFLGILVSALLYMLFKKWFILGILLASVSLGAFCYNLALIPVNQSIPSEQSISITGTISENPEYVTGEISKYVLKGVSITAEDGIKQLEGKVLLTAPAGFEYGDVVYADKASIRYTYEERNPNGYNEQKYLLADGIAFRANADEITKTGQDKNFFKNVFITINKSIAMVIDSTFDASAAPVAKGMLLGDTSSISDDVTSSFSTAGISHIVAVSGLHIGFLAAILVWLLGLLKVGKKISFAVEILILYLFVEIIGAPASAVRAFIMVAVYLIFNLTDKRTDTLIVFSTAFLIILVLSPLSIFKMSFQLSFAAVFGIITVGDLLNRCFKKKKVLSLAAASIGASSGVSLFAARFTGTIAVYSLIGNLLVIPLVAVSLIFILLSVILGLIFAPIAFITAAAGSFIINVIIDIALSISNLPYANISFPSLGILAIALALLLMLVVSKYFFKDKD
ncbi:MAG: ComEC/Rec2 family competence protein [Eubacteriales bacterium]